MQTRSMLLNKVSKVNKLPCFKCEGFVFLATKIISFNKQKSLCKLFVYLFSVVAAKTNSTPNLVSVFYLTLSVSVTKLFTDYFSSSSATVSWLPWCSRWPPAHLWSAQSTESIQKRRQSPSHSSDHRHP